MTERNGSREEEQKPLDLLIIAPSTLDRFIVVVTGNNQIDTPSIKSVQSKNVFTDEIILDIAKKLSQSRNSSFHGFISNAEQFIARGAGTQIADMHYGKGRWGDKNVFIEPADSFENFLTNDKHCSAREIVKDAGLDDELQAVIKDLKIKALIKGTEYQEIVWQNPDSVPKQ